jgi:hypothetical protein
MPWFEAKPVSQVWGWHWTMGRTDPETVQGDRRRIASHDYPMIGPYDSSDPDVLEYHALLMKIAGIDGAAIDWYGTTDFLDYGLVHRNTQRLMETLKRFGLRYVICYEDQSIKHMEEAGPLTREQALERGREAVRWLDTRAFRDPLNVSWKGAPLLLVYGPQYFREEEWDALFSGLAHRPALFSLDVRRPPAVGAFAWPPMWKSKGGTLTPAMLDEFLTGFYGGEGDKMGIAFPGFHDYYAEAGVHPSFGFIDRDNGKLLSHTLDRALKAGTPFIQIATWNDFGEGTEIEPTREHGFRDLETLQRIARAHRGGPFPYQASDLRLPHQIYQLRKRKGSEATRTSLDRVAQMLSKGQVGPARKLLSRLAPPSGKKPKGMKGVGTPVKPSKKSR